MKNSLKIFLAAAAGSLIITTGAQATVFSFDEFFINKNGGEIFRDSFNDGVLPPSGPDDGILGPGGTYSVFGGGFASENAGGSGRLLVDSAAGGVSTSPDGTSVLFNRARRLRSSNPSSSAVLDTGSDWSVNARLDLSILPANPGEAFGIRVEDFSGTNPNGGNDRAVLSVRRSGTTGNLGVSFSGLNFMGVPIETFDFFLLQPLLDTFTTADQIELSITHGAGGNLLDAEFSLFSGGSHLVSQALDNVGNTSGLTASVFSDEAFTRAAIYTIEDVPAQVSEPGALLVLGGGLLAFAGLRRRLTK